MYSAIDIAKFVVSYCNEKVSPISNLKLQKILYFLWIEYYRSTNKRLFPDLFIAWQLGPVIPQVYFEFCAYGGFPISEEYKDINISNEDAQVIKNIINKYILISVSELVNRTHQAGRPWSKVFENGSGKGKVIPYSDIMKYEH